MIQNYQNFVVLGMATFVTLSMASCLIVNNKLSNYYVNKKQLNCLCLIVKCKLKIYYIKLKLRLKCLFS